MTMRVALRPDEIIRQGYIEGVELKELKTYPDQHGFFREVLRVDDSCFDNFGQWSHSMKVQGTIKAWHIHQYQTDYWYVPIGLMRAVLVDMREEFSRGLMSEFLLGDNQPVVVLKIPPGVAHGLKVLQGPAHLFYITSRVYNPDDEGRIPVTKINYDWFKQDIR